MSIYLSIYLLTSVVVSPNHIMAMRICPQSGTESQVGQNSKEEVRTQKVTLHGVSQGATTTKVGVGGPLHFFLKVGGIPGRSGWSHLGPKVAPEGIHDAIE